MKKMPNMFVRDWCGNQDLVTDVLEPRSAWVMTEHPSRIRASRKRDGTCVLITNEGLFKRRTVRPGQKMPNDFVAVGIDNGKVHGWVHLNEGDAMRLEVMQPAFEAGLRGTMEVCGPRINGNPEGLTELRIFQHGTEEILDFPLGFDECHDYLEEFPMEGIVFRHEDGERFSKVKSRDLGLPW